MGCFFIPAATLRTPDFAAYCPLPVQEDAILLRNLTKFPMFSEDFASASVYLSLSIMILKPGNALPEASSALPGLGIALLDSGNAILTLGNAIPEAGNALPESSSALFKPSISIPELSIVIPDA